MRFIYDNHSTKAGIYSITNTITNKQYIGQASVFKERWRHGYNSSLPQNKCHNDLLQDDYNLCVAQTGNDNFLEFRVIEVMDGSTKQDRLEREKYFIETYRANGKQLYNKIFDKWNESNSVEYTGTVLVDRNNAEHIIDGTLIEFSQKHNLPFPSLYSLVSKDSKSAYGWRLFENKHWTYDRTDMPVETRERSGLLQLGASMDHLRKRQEKKYDRPTLEENTPMNR